MAPFYHRLSDGPCLTRVVEPENDIDPDDGMSMVCRACTLPIFSTPFKKHGADFFVHDECDNLPQELSNHVLHRGMILVLEERQDYYSPSCYICRRECGSMMYKCSHDDRGWGDRCEFQLDLLCALQITIVHRSHEHRLTANTGSASFKCGACGTQHPGGFTALSYQCKACDYWIHPDCASLPNAIRFQHHHHSLFLTFSLPSICAGESKCGVCKGVCGSTGVYFCAKCEYYAHIKCAVLTDPYGFEPVLLRKANLAGLLHFPIADEHTSEMPYIMESEEASSTEVDRQHLHPHPLIFHHQDDVDDSTRHCVCNACIQLILPADPFYRCSECPDFFLHKCCANLPIQIQHPYLEDTLFLSPKATCNSSISGCFYCYICYKQSNGFAYMQKNGVFAVDVVCAMTPPSITHQLHPKSHILCLTRYMFPAYACCDSRKGWTAYTCTSCRDFELHVDCARLPSNIKHKFDDHILTLTAGDHLVQQICEICENYIELKHWCYSCKQCDQWFHPDCIKGFSNLKLGGTIKVNCHDCPLALILKSSVYGYHCDSCRQVFAPIRYEDHYEDFEDPYAYERDPYEYQEEEAVYECSNCYFRIHERCAEKCLLR